MTKTPTESAQKLRRRAEEKFSASEAGSSQPLSPEETERLLHELRVHQIELELQNEELRRTQSDLDASKARYFDLYDLAPVGYLTLSEKGLIQEANLTAAAMLGVTRGTLVKRPFSNFIHSENQDNYYLLRKQLSELSTPQDLFTRMLRADGSLFWAHLKATQADNLESWITFSDITSEETLREALGNVEQRVEERTRQLANITHELNIILENAPIGITKMIDRKQVLVNRKVVELFQYAREEMGFQSTRVLYPSDEAYEKLGKEAFPVLAQGLVFETVQDLIRKDGAHVLIRYVGKAVEPSDMSKGIIWMLEDVTSHMRAEEDLRTVSGRLSSVVESTGDVVAMMDNEYRYTLFNTAFHNEFLKIFGKDLKLGDSMLQALEHLPDDLANAVKYWNRAFGGEDFTITQQFGDAKLARNWYELHFNPIRDGEGKVTGAVHIVRNITERKQMEATLQRLTDEQSFILENAGVGITFVQNRQFKWANKALCQMLGYSSEEITDACTRLIYPSQEDYEQTGQEAYSFLATGRTFTKALLLRRSDGSLFHALFNGKVVNPDDPLTGSIWIISDETERYELQAKLVDARDAAESTNRAKSEFLANMSHEIRTPMNGLLGMAQLLEMSDLNEEQIEYLRILKISGKNLLSLINDILDLSKIEAGKLEIAKTQFSLHSCINDIITMQKKVTDAKGLVLESNIASDIPQILMGDQLRIKQIILNLLGNAIKFTQKGGITLSAQLIEKQEDTVLIELAVRDSGVGISAEALEKIFRPFEQEDGSTTRKFGGTGLGLTICRHLTELMGGSISVESTRSVGSCFKITIPFTVDRNSETSAIAQNKTANTWDGIPLRILLVEDDPINIKFGMSLLRKLGHDVTVTENGEECLAALEQDQFDIVLMDIKMPVMDGEEALREIRRIEQGSPLHQPVIALTAHSLRGEKERYMEAGFDGYISKPIEIRELIVEMKRVMG